MERTAVTRHRKGSRARVLLTSVFGPYAKDDAHGSRAINPMELYHNQVTRVQGALSLRMFHRSWGLMLIQANLEAPTTLLAFPSLERFEEEIRAVPYDVVGISASHGQLRFNFRHPRIQNGEETEYLLRAFRRDFEVNGPSVTRIARTLLGGWLALKDHPDPRVRERIAFETKDLATQYAGALWASEKWFGRTNAALAARLRATRRGVEQAFGRRARLAARLVGPNWRAAAPWRVARSSPPAAPAEAKEAVA